MTQLGNSMQGTNRAERMIATRGTQPLKERESLDSTRGLRRASVRAALTVSLLLAGLMVLSALAAPVGAAAAQPTSLAQAGAPASTFFAGSGSSTYSLAGYHTYPHLSVPLPPGVLAPGTPGPHPQLVPKVTYLGTWAPDSGIVAGAPQGAPGPSAVRSTPNILKNGTEGWAGIDQGPPNPCGCYPPDTNNGEGAGYVVETVNTYEEVWSTSGTLLQAQPLYTFFGVGSAVFLSDPQTWYDPTDGHWFQSLINLQNYPSCSPDCWIMMAVSTTSNPTGTWNFYQVADASGILPDQPQIGTDAAGIFISVNDFGSGTAHIFELNKSQAEAGNPTPAEWDTTGPGNLGWGSEHPAHTESLSNTEYFMGDVFGGVVSLNLLGIQGAPPSTGKVTWENLSTAEGAVGCLTVPGGGGMCQIDGRVLALAYENGNLWGAATDGCSGGDCSHFWQVNTGTNPWSMVSDFTWSPPSDTSYYPNLAIDPSGSIGVVFSYSSTIDYPGVGITGRTPVDPANTLETPILVKPGYAVGSSSSRFGDYSGAAYDQATGRYWVSGEWIQQAASSADWDTWIQEFTMGGFFALGSINPNPADVGVPVSFNGTSFGGTGPFTYSWVFGDGSAASHAANPIHAYNLTGTYSPHLWVNETTGLLRSREANLTVTINPQPVPTITVTANPADVGIPVQFAVAITGGTPTYTTTWSFGDGFRATGATVVHNYSAPATYTAQVWVNDSGGGSATLTTPVVVNPQPSVSATATPPALDTGVGVTFTASTSGGTGTLSVAWVFGDGAAAVGSSVSHRYLGQGNYTVRVWANDSLGGTGNYSLLVSVNPKLALLLVSASPMAADTGRPVAFSASYFGGTPGYTYAWRFGDGSSSALASPVHIFTTPGTANVAFWLNDSGGGSRFASLPVQVNPVLAVTSFTGTWPDPAVNAIDLGETLSLAVVVHGGTGTYTFSYTGLPSGCKSWDYATLFCAPTASGTATVQVWVTDQNGASAFGNLTFAVNLDPTISSFAASPMTLTNGTATTLTATASLGTPGYRYSYPALPPGCTSQNNGTLPCTPDRAGTFTAEVRATDAVGVSAFFNISLTVNPVPSITTFTASPSTITQGDTTSFQVSVAGGTAPYTFAYSGLPSGCAIAGNGGSCVPSSSGSYTVQVTVTDADGASAKATTTLNVNAAPSMFAGGVMSLGFLWILLLVLIVIVLVIIVIAVGRRRKSPEGAVLPPPIPVEPMAGDPHTIAPSPEGHRFPEEPAPVPAPASEQGSWAPPPPDSPPAPPPLPPPPNEGSSSGGYA